MALAQLSDRELAVKVRLVKDRALADAFSAEQEFAVSVADHAADAEASDDTAAVLDEVIRRLEHPGGR